MAYRHMCWRKKPHNTAGLFILNWISYSIMLEFANQEQKFMVTFFILAMYNKTTKLSFISDS